MMEQQGNPVTIIKDDDEKLEQDDSEPMDDEGLYIHYDVVICGTGLLQSIIASALARYTSHQLKILHIDGSDHYGNLDAVYTYPYLVSQYEQQLQQNDVSTTTNVHSESRHDQKLNDVNNEITIPVHPMGELRSLQFHSVHRTKDHCILRNNVQVQTVYGFGRITSLIMKKDELHSTLVIELYHWTLANKTHPKIYIGIPSSLITYDNNNENDWSIVDDQYMWDQYHIRTITAYNASLILDHHSRSIAFDITPYLLYAAGPAVDGLLSSKVSDYIEFKSLDAILYYTPSSKSNNTNENKDTIGSFTRVPCSKSDVFASQLLSPMDKRRLMKFLQLALDYAGAISSTTGTEETSNVDNNAMSDELQSWNERYLNQGRSLVRPQNKVVASSDLQHLQELCYNNDHNAKPISFVSYLQNDQKLSPSLISLIRYALALDTNSSNDDNTDDNISADTITTVRQGMEQLCAHMFALGRFGTTAFLVPLYGSGELSQAFCRSAAVYGTTYLLRRAPISIVLQQENNNDESLSSNKKQFKVCGIHVSKPETNETIESSSNISFSTSGSKRISCSHIVIPEGSIDLPKGSVTDKLENAQHKRVLRRIGIVTGKPIQLDSNTSEQTQQQRHVLIIPPKSISINQTCAIHAVVIDESVNVTPHIPGGCTIVHLTTTVYHDNQSVVDDSILSEAMEVILKSFRRIKDDSTVVEIFSTTFSYDVTQPTTSTANANIETTTAMDLHGSSGLHLIQRPNVTLTADIIFTKAMEIFQRICPNATSDDFLKVSQSTTDAIKAAMGEHIFNHNNEDEDDETMVLHSALDMIEHPKTSE